MKLVLGCVALRRWEQFVGGDLREGQLFDEIVDQHFPGLLDSRRGLCLFLQIILALLYRRGSTLRQLTEIEKHVVGLFLRNLKLGANLFFLFVFSVLDLKNTKSGSWNFYHWQWTSIR